MGDIRDAANTTWRDFNTDGVASSGAHEPNKYSIRFTMGVVENKVDEALELAEEVSAGNGAGYLTYTTLSAMNADTTQDDKVTANNLEDDNLYRWNAAGPAWVLIGPNPDARLAVLEASATDWDSAKITADHSNNFLNLFKAIYVDHNATAESGKAVLYADGTEVSVAGRWLSDWIPVTADHAITRFGSGVSSGLYAPYAFYDEDKAFLGASYSAVVEGAQVFDISTAPVGTAFLRTTSTASTSQIYVYDKKLVAFFRDMLFSTYGNPHNQAGTLTAHYINKLTGAKVVSGSTSLSALLEVNANTYLAYGGGLISSADPTQAVYAFFDKFGPCFVSIGSPAVFTKSGHGYAANDKVSFAVDEPLPTGLTAGTDYYVISDGLSTNVFRVSDTEGGTAINTTGTAARINVKRYLGYYDPIAKNLPIRVSDHYAGATRVQVTMPNSETGAVYLLKDTVGEPAAMDMLLTGAIVDYFAPDLLEDGYIGSDGSLVPWGTAYKTTTLIPVVPGQVLYLTTGDVYAGGPTVAGYDADKVYSYNILPGVHLADYTNERIVVPADVYFVRALTRDDLGYTPHFYGARTAQAATEVEVANEDLIYFAPSDVYGIVGEPVYMFPRGIVPDDSVSVAWAVDPAIMETGDNDGTFAVTIASPAVFTRATHGFVAGDEVKLTTTGALPTGLTAGGKYFVLSAGLTTNAFRVSATYNGSAVNTTGSQSGVHTVEKFWGGDLFQANGEVAKLLRTTPTPQLTLKLRALTAGGNRTDVASMTVRLAPSVPVNPSSAINIIGIGDSTTAQLSDNGTWVNELSRLLTGTGTASLTVDADPTSPAIFKRPVVAGDIPAAGSISNVYFRGTLGGGPVKHEGRSGWSPLTYLASSSGNAFWNAAMSGYGPTNSYKFDMNYYITTNNFDSGSIATGVDGTGSNMLVIILLGWNDVFEDGEASAVESATSISYMIDNIHDNYPDAMVWLVGLWSPSKRHLKNNSSTQVRYYSKPEVFDVAVRRLGKAYRDMIAERAGPCEFVCVSHVFDSDMAYSNSRFPRSRRTTYDGDASVNDLDSLETWGDGDFVHPGARGYSFIADALFYKFRYDYCRG